MSVAISNNYVNIQNKPAFCGTKANKQENKWKRNLKYIELVPGSPVSDTFVKEMAQGLESTGIVGKKVIKNQNLKCILAQKRTDAFPISGAYWEELSFDNAAAESRDGIIGLFEKPVGQPKASAEVVQHEIGHELHKSFKKVIGVDFKDTEGFTEVFLKDMEKLPENLKKHGRKVKDADYYINCLIKGSISKYATDLRKHEVFAEIYAMLNGKSVIEGYSKGMDKLYRKIFPNTVAYIEKLLWLLGKR